MQINLSGIWKATEDLGAQARAGKPGYNDTGWRNVPVPGHWQESPGLERHTGTLLYRKTFIFDRPLAPNETARLRFEGIFYDAKVWCNGAFSGEQKGYFIPELYDVTKHLRQGENVVMVEVACPPEENPAARRQITGVFGGWSGTPPGAEPGGIWREVSLEIYHGVVPGRLSLQAVPDQPFKFELDLAAMGEGTLAWTATVTPETFEGLPITVDGTQPTRRGANRLQANISIPDPRLWWTWDHGRPDLYRLTLELRHNGGPAHRIERLFGIRSIELRDNQFYLNGQRIFLRGTTYGPADIRLGRVNRQRYRQDLDLMAAANINTARIYAHVAGADLYEEASRRGILLWQDFPLHRLYSRSIGDDARRQARAMVDLLGHWPAIGLWCCHNEPVRHGEEDDPTLLARSLAMLSGIGGNWNKSSLAPALRAVIRQADPTRPCIAHAGDWGPGGGRLFWGWYTGQVEELGNKLKANPDLARFVTGFGAQAFPVAASSKHFVSGRWPNINWSDLAERHMLQPKTMERHIPQTVAQTFADYSTATQMYQAYLHKHHIEQFRRRKYQPTGGVLQYRFTDSAPGVSCAIVDYWREPKPAYHVVKECYNPLYICADWPQGGYAPGARLALQVYLINDRHQPFDGTWTWAIERDGVALTTQAHAAHLPPDSAALAPDGLQWLVPADLSAGAAELVLTLEIPGETTVVNRYKFSIVPPQ